MKLPFWPNIFGKPASKSAGALQVNVVDGLTAFNEAFKQREKLQAVLSSPAALKVFALQCDLFSLGKVYAYKDGKEVSDPFLDLLKSPNVHQSGTQLLWDFMFWKMLGNAYLYHDNNAPDSSNVLYFLSPQYLQFSAKVQSMAGKPILSRSLKNELDEEMVNYLHPYGTMRFKMKKLILVTDLSNGLGNYYEGFSRVEALYKIISNSETALNAKSTNLLYAGKFLIGSPNEITKMPLSDKDKKSVIDNIESEQVTFPVNSMVEIRRFVENFAQLELDQAYAADYFKIGSMYGIPRDVLEAYNEGSTYENQEKARASHVTYTLEPAAKALFEALKTKLRIANDIEMSWDHLPLMQVFEKERAEVSARKVETLNLLLNMGVSLEEANQFMDTSFTKAQGYERKRKTEL